MRHVQVKLFCFLRPKFARWLWAVAVLLLAFATGCSEKKTGEISGASGEPSGELVVFAAASLTDAFTELADEFEDANPKVKVITSFAGSQSLRTQIQNGAQPQVFASANEEHMAALIEQGIIAESSTFAHNELVIAVPASNPAKIHSLQDLPKAGRLVLAAKSVPAGAYAQAMLTSAGSAYGADFADAVEKNVVSRENHVRQTLQKVVLGEADAAIVYATDATAAGDKVAAIEIPTEHNVVAAYPIGIVSSAPRSSLGRLFQDFVLSEAGRSKLRSHGFRPAPR